MNIRERTEIVESQILSEYARLSVSSRGREHKEPECDVRTAYQRDRDRILHSKAFRRLKHKTQVFISPEGDHYRTRLTHTLEVAQIARTIARGLRLNEDLTEAIALGHDLGHTPFGHAGEQALDTVYEPGFRHNLQSLRVVEVLERRCDAYPGLNLTFEVRDGIRNHTGEGIPATLEGQIVRIADRVAYINHDIDDAIRAGIITPHDLPAECVGALGSSGGQRIDTMVRDLIRASMGCAGIRMSPDIQSATDDLRTFLFERVYTGSAQKLEEERKVRHIVRSLFEFFVDNPKELEQGVQKVIISGEERRIAADYIAGMTDRFAVSEYVRRFLPKSWAKY